MDFSFSDPPKIIVSSNGIANPLVTKISKAHPNGDSPLSALLAHDFML